MELLILITTSTFLLLWNVLAVIGLIFIITKLIKSFNSKGQKSSKVVQISQKNIKKKLKKPKVFDPGVFFLNSSIILIWLSSLFLGFSHQFIADRSMTKWYLIILLIVHFGAIFIIPQTKRFFRSHKILLNLTLLSIFYFGIRFWSKNLSIYSSLKSTDYYLLLTIFTSAISLIYYKFFNSKIYLSLGTALIIAGACLSGPTAFENKIYVYPFIMILLLLIYLGFRFFLRKDENYAKSVLPILRISVIILGIMHMFFVVINQFNIDTTKETLANIGTLFIPLIFTILVKLFDKRSITLILEGLLFPWRSILVSSLLLLGASSYHAWAISLICFVGAGVLSFTTVYNNSTLRRFIFPMLLSGFIGSLLFMFIKPFYVENFDPFTIGITLLVLQIFIALKACRYNFYKMRTIEPVLQILAIISILYSLDLNYSTAVYNQNIFALILVIPATVSFIETLLSHKLQMTRYTSFNSLFLLTMAVILSIASSILNISISVYLLILMIIMTYLHNTSLFGFPITALTVITTTAIAYLYKISGIELLILNGVVLAFIGNLWRIGKIVGLKEGLTYDLFQNIKRSVIIIASVLLLFSFLTINFEDHKIVIFYVLLGIIFLFSPNKGSIFKYIAPVSLILIFWHLINLSDTPKYANAQLYAFPVVMLTLFVSCKSERSSKLISQIFLFLTLTLPMNIALVQSILDPHPFNLIQGFLLIFIALIFIIFGHLKKYKLLKFVSFVYLFIEIFIIWMRYLYILPWWFYPAVIGVIFLYLSLRITLGISDSFAKK